MEIAASHHADCAEYYLTFDSERDTDAAIRNSVAKAFQFGNNNKK